jgi:hypothetical protein
MTSERKSKAYRAFLYETLVLAIAIDRLRHNPEVSRTRPFANDQLAIEAALIKSRSLLDFLKNGLTSNRDVTVGAFGMRPFKMTRELNDYRNSVSKFSAHITWQRADRDPLGPKHPTRAEIIKRGGEILQVAWSAIQGIDEMLAKDKSGKKYYNCLKKMMKS